MPRDHITVYERETATASVEGWGTHPREYRIEGVVTILRQLVDFAGGPKTRSQPECSYTGAHKHG